MKNKKKFYIQLSVSIFKKGDVLSTCEGEVLVLKFIKNTWWRRLLQKLGFKIHIGYCQVTLL